MKSKKMNMRGGDENIYGVYKTTSAKNHTHNTLNRKNYNSGRPQQPLPSLGRPQQPLHSLGRPQQPLPHRIGRPPQPLPHIIGRSPESNKSLYERPANEPKNTANPLNSNKNRYAQPKPKNTKNNEIYAIVKHNGPPPK